MRLVVRIAGTLLMLVAGAWPSAAQDIVVGWEGDNGAGYAFVAPTAGFHVTPAQSLLVRASASMLYYNSQADGPTDVTAPGGAVAVGYRVSHPRVSAALFAGFERRRINQGWEQGPAVSGELFASATRLTQLSALGNFAQANRYAWARVGAKRQLTNRDFRGPHAISVGIEATGQGNKDVSTVALGGLLEHAWFHGGASLQFRAGYSVSTFHTGPDQRTLYVGAGIYRRF
jgi:hypothetical protein